MLKYKLAIFVSGSGSNLQSIIDAIDNKYIDNAEIALIIASKEGIYALDRAKKANIKSVVYNKNNYSRLDKMFDAMIMELVNAKIDYIVLAGYLSILSSNIIKKFPNQIINIHPSLIPKYCGDGFYGMRVHQAVIDNKENESGATVHYVNEGIDTGEIILQEKVPVHKEDTAEDLAKRVLELEHKLLPKAIKKILIRR